VVAHGIGADDLGIGLWYRSPWLDGRGNRAHSNVVLTKEAKCSHFWPF
jgi:hypothetical protein